MKSIIRKTLILFSGIIFSTSFTIAQTGPGGVGNDTTNLLWLDATNISGYSDGDPIDAWPDSSGNLNHGEQTGSSRPTYETNVINGLPAVYFDGIDDYIDTLFTVPDKNMTIFTVFAHDHDDTNSPRGPLWQNDNTSSNSGFFPKGGDGNYYLWYGSNWLYSSNGTDFNRNTWIISQIERGTNNTAIYKKGFPLQSTSNNSIATNEFVIGSRAKKNEYYRGYISELIFYNRDLNKSQEVIVTNYLSAKYNIDIIPDDKDKFGYKTNYGHGMAGIGQKSSDDKHTLAASDDMLYIGNPSDLDDGEYFMWGHNNGNNSWTTTDAPYGGAANQRLEREWRVSKDGVGAVDISVDTSNIPSLPSGYHEYVLFVDEDTDFSNNSINEYKLEFINGRLTAEDIVLIDGSFITIGAIQPVQFETANSRIVEANTSANIVISIPETKASEVSVDYAIISGTATQGIDYNLSSGTAAIPAGGLTDTIKVDIFDDNITEGSENLIIELSNPSNARLGKINQHTLTIEDNDLFFTGPAGVGDSSTNRLWLRGNDLESLADGESVSTWQDQSGNNFDASQSGTSRPTLVKNTINGLPAVSFDGNDDYFDNIFSVQDENITIFTVFAHDHDDTRSPRGPLWMADREVTNSGFYPKGGDGNYYLWDGGDWLSSSGGTSFNRYTWYLSEIERGANKTAIYQNGSSINSSSNNTISPTDFIIGLRPNKSEYFRGEIAELIFYDYDLNDAQQHIVTNYLSSKYDLAIANDLYGYEPDYRHDVAGIGREDVQNVHAYAQSANILQIGNASDLDNGEYLLFGHNGRDVASWSTDAALGGYRLDRAWRLDETGDVGYVSMGLDTTGLPEPPVGMKDYVVWVLSDADTTLYPMSETNGSYEADSIQVAGGDSVTIGMVNTIQFELASSGGSEGIGTLHIKVALNDTLATETSVDYALSSTSTASAGGNDFTMSPSSGTITIPAGEVKDSIEITINDDADTETEETIIINLTNASGAILGARSTHTFTINDNDFGGITGPGGIGDATTNTLWLRASDITGLADNEPVTLWPDTSGNDHDASQSNASYQPSFKNDLVNGLPVVRFDGVDDHTDNIHAYNATTVFAVFNVRQAFQEDTDLGQLWGNYNDDAHLAIDARSGNEQGFSFDGDAYETGNHRARYALSGGDYGSYVYDNNSPQWTYDNNELVSAEFETQQNLTRQVLGSLHPAFDEDDHNFGGDIAELIVYNKALNNAQKVIIENYLAAKYGLSLTQNDHYAYEASHKYDLAGIGRTGATEYQTAAQSSKILTVSNATSLDSSDFLLFAHDNEAVSNWSDSDIPGGSPYYKRINREWRFDQTNDIGTYTIKVDTSLFAARPAGYSVIKVLADADGDFSSGATEYDLQQAGSSSEFETSGVEIPDGYYVTIAIAKPVFEFTTATLKGDEGNTDVAVSMHLNIPLDQNVIFDIKDAGTGTATSGDDYTSVPPTTDTIPAGDTLITFNLEIIDDGDQESDETVALTLENINGANPGANDTLVYTIHDNDWSRDIQFLSSDSAITEDADSIGLVTEISSANASDSTWVSMLFSGTASGDSIDYAVTDTTFAIPPGDTLDTLYIPIIDDTYNEDNETIVISLDNPVNAQLGAADTITVTIEDNDPVPTIQFTNAAKSVSETVDTANLEVALSNYSGKTVTADYTVSAGSATADDDYTLADGQVSISSGEYRTFIKPKIWDDADIEVSEDFTITLSSPANATLGVNEEITVTIVDDDLASYSFTGPGGVGNDQNNKLWLRADSIGLGDGASVADWYDVSGNNHDVSQGAAGNQPTFETGEINGMPVVSFDGVNDYLIDSASYTGRDAYIVFRMSSADQDTDELSHLWGNYQEGVQVGPDPRSTFSYQYGYSFDGGEDSEAKYGHNGEPYGAYAPNNNNPSEWTYDDTYLVSVRFEEGQSLTQQILGSCYPGHSVGDHQLGGDIAEVIVYNSPLNDAQKIIVENYLSSKYNIALNQNDYYNHDIGGNGTSYYYDVAGIGQTDSDNRHLSAQSAGMLRLYDTSGVQNNEFLLYGHNNAGYSAWSDTEVPAANLKRIDREWRLSETGDLGNVELYLDTSKLADFPAGYSGIEVWIDSDGDFSSGATRHELTLYGNEFGVKDLDISDGDYITFGLAPLQVSFANTSATGSEEVSPAEMVIALSQTSSGSVEVDYETADISATAGSDYTYTSGTAVIEPGELTDTITVPITDDSDTESNEQFEVTLSNPANTLIGADTTFTYTILDNDGLGQYGPGGVATITGEINLWLDTENPPAQHAHGTPIGSENSADEWKDNPQDSGTVLNAYQDNSDQQPVWYTETKTWNNRPVIEFDGSNDFLEINDNTEMNESSSSERFFMVAFKTGSDVSSNQVIFEEGGTGNGFSFYIEDDSLHMTAWTSEYTYLAAEIQPNTAYVAFYDYEYAGGASELNGVINGTILGPVTGTVDVPAHTGDIGIGDDDGGCCFKETCGGGGAFGGQIAEFVSGQITLNTTRRNIIANYLAAKYGISMSGMADRYSYESNYGYRVTGIGRESASDNHYTAQNRDILKISNPSDIDDGEYLFIGNNGEGIGSWSTANTPGSNVQRLSREWRADITGDPGTVSLAVVSDTLPSLPAGFDDYVLMVDQDGDYSEGATYYQLSDGGNGYHTANNVPLNSGDHLAIAALNKALQFTTTASSGEEDEGTFTIEVRPNLPPDAAASVDFATFDSTASSTQDPIPDYADTSGTLSFDAGDTAQTITITVNNETKPENDEVFGIVLSNPINGYVLGQDSIHLHTIFSNDMSNQVQFQTDSSGGDEGTSPAKIEIVLTENNPDNEVSVDYEVLTSGTAGSNDYTLDSTGTVTFPTNDMSQLLEIPINDDTYNEPAENIMIRLSNPVNARRGDIDTTQYTITDNDPVPTLTFSTDTISSSEAVTSKQINVYLSEQSGYDISFDYQATDITATGGGVDYALPDGSVTIPAGDTTGTFSISVTDDTDEEPNEFLELSIDNITNANPGSLTTTTFVITDNDGLGIMGPGGIGSFSGGEIDTWLDTYQSDNLEDGDAVKGDASPERWFDKTGNGHDAYQNTSANRPVFWRLSPTWNGNPLLDFKSYEEQFLEIADNEAMNNDDEAQSERTIITVFRTGEDISNRQVVYEEGGGTRGLNMYIENDSLYIGGWNYAESPWDYTSVRYKIKSNTPYFAIMQFDYETKNAISGFLNGELKILEGGGLLYPHADDIGIGAMNGGSCFDDGCGGDASYFDGFIAELISGRTVYNSAQQKIINNYLAAKYNVDLPAGLDLYDYDLSYHSEVIGIGQDSISSNHLAAQGSGIIKINNAGSVGDGKYMFIGHNDDSIAAWSNNEVPDDDANIYRVQREWRVDKQGGDIGAVDLHVDTSRFENLPAGFNDYIIMVDEDGDFTAGATVTKLTYTGQGYFTSPGINFDKGDHFTIGVIRPAIQFSQSASGGPENIDEYFIDLELNYQSGSDVQVDYHTSDITASATQTPTADYEAMSGTLTMPAGEQSASLSLTINNDLVSENDEDLLITLSNPTAGVAIGRDTTHTFTIQDDDLSRKVQFSRADSSNTEDISPITLDVELTEPNNDSSTTVEYRVLTDNSTATADSVDYYVPLSDTLTFATGVTETTLTLDIIDDMSDEYDETVVIELFDPQGANLGFNTIHTYTIADNDPGPVISFTADSTSGMESISPAEIDVILSVESGREVTVDYEASDITATGASVDYQLNAGTLTFPAGEDTLTLNPDIFNDRTEEDNEDFKITLTNPVNASLGTKDELRYIILDNDGLGIDGPGGVGNTQNQVDAWLRTTDMPEEIYDGIEISTDPYIWPDITGHGLDAYQTDAGNRPMYWDETADWFGKPVLEFQTGNDDYLEIADNDRMNTSSGPQNKRTIIVAFRPTSDITTHQVVYEEGGGLRGLSLYVMDDSLYIGGWNYPDDQGDADESTPWGYVYVAKEINVNTPYFAVLQFNFDEAGVGTVSGFLNGEDLGALPGAGRLYPHGGNIGIGGENGDACYHYTCGGGNSFDGYISEFLSGNMVYNRTQFKLVNNYFAAKYNVTLPSGEDLYDYEVNHSNEVFGIGQESSSESHYTAQGQGPIKISNPSNAGNGKYLLIGNDDGDMDKWYEYDETDVPDSSKTIRRVKREWRVDKQGGDLGTIDFYMDESEMPTKAIGYPTYVLMVDTVDDDFTDCNIFYELTDQGDGYYKAGAIDFNKGDYFTIGLVKPTVEFGDTTYSAFETDTAFVEASLNFIPGQAYQVDYYSTDGTAISPEDYDTLANTLNFGAGTRTKTIEAYLNDDDIDENTESFTLTLENPQNGLIIGDDTTTTINIIDNDSERQIYFARFDSSDNESETPIAIEVLLSRSNSSQTTRVAYSVTGGTASGSGTDYTLPADTLEFLPDDTVETISLAINDDTLDEPDENVIISLSEPINANLSQGDSAHYDYTIVDNDTAPEVQFKNDTATASESYSPALLEVNLDAVSGRDITLDYTTWDITAEGGEIDYGMNDGESRQLTIPAGLDSALIHIDIVNDLIDEPAKSFLVELTNPDHATIGEKDTLVYNIIDDDGLGYTGPGGIGDNSQYKLWYRPDAETAYSDGDAVTLLNDQSNNGNDATSGSNHPSYEASEINGRAVVSFDGTVAMDIANSGDINDYSSAQEERTFVVSFRTGADVSTRQVIYEEGGGTRGLNIYIDGSELYFGGWNLAEDSWGFTSVSEPVNPHTEYMAILEMNARDTVFRGWLNGTLMGEETDVNSLYSHGGAIRFGANESAVYHDGSSDADHYFTGDVMQLLSYNVSINVAQRKIIENYFASEYGNQIETDLSQDLYDYRASYGYEVFGIGQEDINNNHMRSQGTGMVRIDQPDDVDNAEYLLAGHDNGDISSWTTAGLALDSTKRIDREWRVTLTGDPGEVRISIDTSQFPPKPDNYNLYGILVDSDGDFSSGNETLHPLYVRSGNFVMNHGINFSDGDYFTLVVGRNRTIASGNWNDPSIWLKGEVPAADDQVLISVEDTVQVNANVEIGAVTMDDRSSIIMNGNYDFDLTEGGLSIGFDADFQPNNGRIIYSADGPQCVGGMTYYDLEIRGSGAKTLCGDITVTHFFQIFEDAPTLSLDVTASNYSITLNCDWANNATFIPGDGSVIMNGNNLSITTDNTGAETFNKLDVRTSGTLTLEDHVYVSDTLFMNGSNINTGSDTLTIGNGAPATLVRNSGIVLGNMERWIGNTTDAYIYPIGTSATLRPLIIQTNSLPTPGYAVATYTASDPGDDGLASIWEDNLYMVDNFTEGYWRLSENGMSSGDYNVEAVATGYSSADVIGAGTRLVSRAEGATDWTLNGNHADVTGDTIRRNNVSTLPAEFAVSDTMSCLPVTSDISGEDTVCANASGVSYSVTDHAGSDYTWSITGGSQASGSTTHSITVNWGSAGSGEVEVTEDNGCAVGDPVTLDVTINPYPDDPGDIYPLTPDPDTLVEGNSKIYSIDPVTHATYYNWNVPAAFIGDSDSTEITLTADGIPGSEYTIEVEAMNACGSSTGSSTRDIYIKEGLPAKAATPSGPTDLCQASGDTNYTTTGAVRATSYEWGLLTAGGSTIAGTGLTGTLSLAESFNGTLGVRVRGVNANGNGAWSDALDVTVDPQPDGTLTAVLDTICEGDSTELEVSFSAGNSPYTLIYSDDTANDTIDPVPSNPYTFYPENHPQWNEGASDTTYYYMSKITDSNGCVNTDVDTTSVIILKLPDTGTQQFVPNEFDE